MTRVEAANNARRKRTIKVKLKINNAIDMLKLESEKVTVRKVAELAEVSHVTAAKYLKMIREKAEI